MRKISALSNLLCCTTSFLFLITCSFNICFAITFCTFFFFPQIATVNILPTTITRVTTLIGFLAAAPPCTWSFAGTCFLSSWRQVLSCREFIIEFGSFSDRNLTFACWNREVRQCWIKGTWEKTWRMAALDKAMQWEQPIMMWRSDILYLATNVRGFGKFLKTVCEGEGYNISCTVSCWKFSLGTLVNHCYSWLYSVDSNSFRQQLVLVMVCC